MGSRAATEQSQFTVLEGVLYRVDVDKALKIVPTGTSSSWRYMRGRSQDISGRLNCTVN